jgi:GntR family transcriptional regulator
MASLEMCQAPRDIFSRDVRAGDHRAGTASPMPEPKYRQIANDLRAAIRAGDYEPGDRLPGENDLMATYGVARMTARQALGVLTTEGVADARKGSGVYVRDFTPVIRAALTRLSHERWSAGASIWSADADGRDIRVTTTVTEAPPPERIAPLLALEDDELVCIRSRRFVLDGKPVLLSTSYLPASIVAGSAITQEDTGPGGTYARLAELGHGPAHFREDVRARMPQPEETEALDLPTSGSPVVDIVRTAFTEAGQAVEVNEMTLDASAYILRYDFSA